MRRLVIVVLVLAVVVAGLSVGDIFVRRQVEGAIARRIEAQVPGSLATVHIGSFPFVGRLLVLGTVPQLTATVDSATTSGIQVSSIVLVVHDLKVGRSRLLQRQAVLEGIGGGRVTAVVTQAEVDKASGLPLVLEAGSVSLFGVRLPADTSVVGGEVRVALPGGHSVTLALPHLAVLPCVDHVYVEPGQLRLSCTLTSLPPALSGYRVNF